MKHRTILSLTLVLLFWLVLFTAWQCEQIGAQSQDPLQEKLDFLKSKLEGYLTYSVKEGGGSPDLGNLKFEAVSFEGCRIAWRSSMTSSTDSSQGFGDFRILNDVSVDLSSIDAKRTKLYIVEKMVERNIPRALILELNIRPGVPGFRHQMAITKDGRVTRNVLDEKSYAFFFHTKDRSIAEDVANAFAEANTICRSPGKRGH